MFRGGARRASWSWRKRIGMAALGTLLLTLVAGFILTDASPLVADPPPPTAAQVETARIAARQFKSVDARRGRTAVRFDTAQMDALGIMASSAFDPDGLRIVSRKGMVSVVGSHHLPLGRWLNVTIVTRGGGSGFPPVRITIGSASFSPWASRWIIRAARRAVILRGAEIPPLDQLVRRVQVRPDAVAAFVTLPADLGLGAQLPSDEVRASARLVGQVYCRLAKVQAAKPSTDFIVHVRRAFAMPVGAVATPVANRAAIVALAMLTVDPRVGELVDLPPATLARCHVAPTDTVLNGRIDLPKHWVLSAALAATTGTRFSQAIGEWKELADGAARAPHLAPGDPSGFSFLDLAADRSGFLIAGLAVDPLTAPRTAAAMTRASADDLLPPPLMRLPDGMANAAFVARYGSTKDPRFLAATAQIDAILRRSATRWAGPLVTPTQP